MQHAITILTNAAAAAENNAPIHQDQENYEQCDLDLAVSNDCRAAIAMLSAPKSQSLDLARIITAWNEGVERWRENHDSIPTAFLDLAAVTDSVKSH
jgi:hypothetical protein